MKKILLTLSMAALNFAIFAQCTPDPQYTANGNWPKALAVAWVDSSYSSAITNVVPKDTVVKVTGVPVKVYIDSVKIINIEGIPAGYSSSCTPAKCVYLGGTKGCFLIFGTTNDQSLIGKHPLAVYTKTYAHTLVFGSKFAQKPQLDTVTSYFLEIKSAKITGINGVSTIENLNVYPNPTQGLFTANAFLKEKNIVLRVYNTLGEIINNEFINLGNNTLNHPMDLSNVKSGIYFIEITTSKETMRQKILINK